MGLGVGYDAISEVGGKNNEHGKNKCWKSQRDSR